MSAPALEAERVVGGARASPMVHLRIPGAGWRLCDESVGPSNPRRLTDWQRVLSAYGAPPACATCLWCMAIWLKLWRA